MRIQQVLLNLLSNAIAYSPEESRIDVRMREADGEMILEVQDYGIGIPEDAKARIFGRFFQGAKVGRRTNRGLGLGLFITQEIVNAHGGRIDVDSSDGEGTTFRVHLPREADQARSG
jgi:signal transduction histidine kinase